MITLNEENGKIILVSKGNRSPGILHYGSYLTVEDMERGVKFILRVEESFQTATYEISPMLVDMDLKPLIQDQSVKNVVKAVRIAEIPLREDGMSSYIRPLLTARVSNQEEINYALGQAKGIPIFPATAYARNCQILKDENGKAISVNIPDDFFFHQVLITGATGSGKTAAMKYLAQYFAENLNGEDGEPGAVLAVNVKEEDLLYMDKPTVGYSDKIKKEWEDLGLTPHGVGSFSVYYPGNKMPNYTEKVDPKKCESITIKVKNLEPENIIGLVPNLSLHGSEQLPNIFRYWKDEIKSEDDTMKEFIHYFDDPNKNRIFKIKTSNGDEYDYKMNFNTYSSIKTALMNASDFFDTRGSKELEIDDILERRKVSVIDVTSKVGIGFGSVLLRNILNKIYEAKSQRANDVPVLVIIDEVHEFYGSARSREALSTLDAITRKGRSLGIGVIFASQNPEDIPGGISKVVNSEISFKGSIDKKKIKTQFFDIEGLRSGYAVTKIHGLSQIKLAKFPLTLGGLKIER
jgi:Cdc6-like AAA superfamily ATPase